jgi:peptidyl-prolyl cis-trans isomerase D
MEVIDKIPSNIPEFDTVKEKVKKDWIKAEQNELARASANDLLGDLKNGMVFDEAADKFGLRPQHTEFFKRNASIPDIGYESKINQVAFGLSEDNPLPAEAIGSQKGFYVIRYRDRKAPAADQFDSQKAQIKQRLLQQKRFRTFEAWLLDTKSKAEIFIEDKFQES